MFGSRRRFLQGLGRSALAGAMAVPGCRNQARPPLPPLPGGIVGGAHRQGHRLREPMAAAAAPTGAAVERCDVIVAGAGVAGLAAARKLRKLGVERITILELESAPGGTSISGRNAVSPYPWGAHYLPLPNAEAVHVRELLEELGVITGHTPEGLPLYEETMLCAEPNERLFLHGRWQEGLLPILGATDADHAEYARFAAMTHALREARGSDGRYAFAIPLDESSADAEWRALDAMTMAAWLHREGFRSAALRWFVDYSCRDDFGAGIEWVSAWAGLHYFAARRSTAGNASAETVLTWPEGNGWLVKRMAQGLQQDIRPGQLVFHVENDPRGGVVLDALDTASGRVTRYEARAAILALPRFIAQRVVRDLPPVEGLVYSPWMVANLTVKSSPTGRGAPLAWDNVIQRSASLGYVVATHQAMPLAPGPTVLTHYWPLDAEAPSAMRERMLQTPFTGWRDTVLDDLQFPHPEIRDLATHLDVWLWGHGMIRPTPGFLWGRTRETLRAAHGAIVFAHSDLSGMALFEEAYTRGVQAAERVYRFWDRQS